MNEEKVWFKIEQLIPAINAIGSRDYWTYLCGEDGMIFKTSLQEMATAHARNLLNAGRKVRVVRVTEEVVDVP